MSNEIEEYLLSHGLKNALYTIRASDLKEDLFGTLVPCPFQYIHGLAARGVHYLHRPGPTLQDLGFMLLPELGQERAYISESLFTVIFLSFFLWNFHPFIFKTKKIYTVLIWCRALAFLVASQALRIVTFYLTQLPGPNYHCREGSPLATLPHPKSVVEVLLINFPHGVIYRGVERWSVGCWHGSEAELCTYNHSIKGEDQIF